jgi:ribonuclease HI/retron-type reverse transcriptase
MGQLFQKATQLASLRNAWHRIRENGSSSLAIETRIAVETFGREIDRNLHKIQRKLREDTFEFEPQKGVPKKKTSGGKRGIVMASVQNRIVERAWLDCLQDHSSFIKRVISQPSSVGGVPRRSVPHGLKLIRDAFAEGKIHFVRSDISGFFDNIPRQFVLNKIGSEMDDQRFLEVLDAATKVVLSNEKALGEDRKIFPTDDQGVAQGSPLSPLFGNVLLHDFDLRLNERGVICIRFIDDFLLLGDSESQVVRAFRSARAVLRDLGLNCHDPFQRIANTAKADFGKAENGFIFLGYDIRPGLFQPSHLARQKFEQKIDEHLANGRRSIHEVRKAANSLGSRQRYTQTLTLLDKVVRGWGESFSYGNSQSTIEGLDLRIEKKLTDFRSWFSRQIVDADWKTRRRLGGVCLLSDIPQKDLDDVPFSLEPGKRFVRSSNTLTISTDGSIVPTGRERGREQGPGGWAFIVHETGERRSGRIAATTNNRMELTAVIEAIKFATPKHSIIIRTDSQYVSDAINKGTIVKSNSDLWAEFDAVRKSKRLKVVWVKGHAGDEFNETADRLAAEQAALAKTSLIRSAA